ncbi:phosphatase PAP2 family protein [unidentified bacterial endosymbiont]|uniref:phosphatase PAP2 family protein n=1 Tax=unidentified bacterial endosymbiont TaxID=2355 RepID=UPI00209E198B|nr:phosphatase PAP2 family protein [unidentified bacterial endosymbiont]
MVLDGIVVAKALLILSHAPTLALLIVLGFIWWSRQTFYHITSLMLLAGIASAALKATFKVPLPPALGIPGFGFPSGHMLMATVLYTSIAYKAKRPSVTLLISLLLVGIGYSLVYRGYHYYSDVFGALVFALLLMIGYTLCCKKIPETMPWLTLALATAMVCYLHQITPGIPFYVWVNYYALFGLVVGSTMVQSTSRAQPVAQKILATLFWVLAISALSLYLQKLFWQGTPRTKTSQIKGLLTSPGTLIVMDTEMKQRSIINLS